MKDNKVILLGIAIFIVAALSPFWLNLGKAAKAPEPILTEKAKAAGACVLPKELMKADHMELLDVWRDQVVREGERVFVNADGKKFNMSLSNTCLDCHENKAEFCDRCHQWASADPYCWDCHIDNPKEKK